MHGEELVYQHLVNLGSSWDAPLEVCEGVVTMMPSRILGSGGESRGGKGASFLEGVSAGKRDALVVLAAS